MTEPAPSPAIQPAAAAALVWAATAAAAGGLGWVVWHVDWLMTVQVGAWLMLKGWLLCLYYPAARWISGVPFREDADPLMVILGFTMPLWGAASAVLSLGLLPGGMLAIGLYRLPAGRMLAWLLPASGTAALAGAIVAPMVLEAGGFLGLVLFPVFWHSFTAASLLAWAVRARVRQAEPPGNPCGRCGYDLTGCPGPVCPECGQPMPGHTPPGRTEEHQSPCPPSSPKPSAPTLSASTPNSNATTG